ncbi:MAG: fumarylacetoacetate hydrolase family protein [Betaproteobacteria bacterium]|nr:fumarylacetoacetate hydrolase family protein [Betaproteobacteria bacterium]
MKLLCFQDGQSPRCAALIADLGDTLEIFDLRHIAALAEARDIGELAAAPAEALAALRARLNAPDGALRTRRIARSQLLAPIPRPARNVFCVGRNYLEHVREGDLKRGIQTPIPQHPQYFTKPPSTVVGDGGAIEIEPSVSDKIDYEVELAVVIGTAVRNASAESATASVFGYTIINDVTARDLQRRHDQWFKGKGLDTFCPMGPWVVTQDEIADPHSLGLQLWVNGDLRQSDTTAHMHFKLGQIIADLSQGMTLLPGDVIATGTPPGVGYAMTPPQFLRAGDVVTCEIERIGRLSNPVRLRRD